MSENMDECKNADVEEVVEQSPDEQLATAICTRLIDDELAPKEKLESITEKIATGQMVAEDWRVLAAAAIKDEQTAKDDVSETAAEERGAET